MVTPGILSVVGDGSGWTEGSVNSSVGRDSLVAITVAADCGVAGAAQALTSNVKAHTKINFVFIVFSVAKIDFPLTMIRWQKFLLKRLLPPPFSAAFMQKTAPRTAL
jgi:hypothetical protein